MGALVQNSEPMWACWYKGSDTIWVRWCNAAAHMGSPGQSSDSYALACTKLLAHVGVLMQSSETIIIGSLVQSSGPICACWCKAARSYGLAGAKQRAHIGHNSITGNIHDIINSDNAAITNTTRNYCHRNHSF